MGIAAGPVSTDTTRFFTDLPLLFSLVDHIVSGLQVAANAAGSEQRGMANGKLAT